MDRKHDMRPDTQSLWSRSIEIPHREALKRDLQADAVVIGAGMAGVLIADRLQKRGIHTIVIEAERIGSGQTKNTTAKITSQHGVIYDALIRNFGKRRAGQYAEANERAIDAYASMILERKIDCDFKKTSAYIYTMTDDDPMRREAEAAAELGIDAHFTRDTELPFKVVGAERFDNQAQFHPLKFLKAVSDELEIYERTPVLNVDGNNIQTPFGTVRAEKIVFATHYPFINVPGWYFMRVHQERSYVLAMDCGWTPEGMYLGVDNDGLSFRGAEGCLLLGGGSHRTGENSAGGRYRMLSEQAQALFRDYREIARWSAQDCITLDGMPYIGGYSTERPDWYVATGFAKWGMTSSMAAAMCIAGEITGDRAEWAEVFSPSRFKLSAAGRNLAKDTIQSFKGLTREIFSVPKSVLDELPRGHGGIVEIEGRKMGVYKDEAGACHIVNTRCPHLGCQLEWNPDEKSWDCPCHGSRFHYDGSLIDNPAQKPLKESAASREK